MFASALKKFSFTKRAEFLQSDHVFLVRGRDASGERAWYYVLIDKGKRDAFKATESAPYLKLTDYGKILYSGFGEAPPEDVKKQMEEEYGFKE